MMERLRTYCKYKIIIHVTAIYSTINHESFLLAGAAAGMLDTSDKAFISF
jgi:hypothetical protein